jgi:hypothetical protein
MYASLASQRLGGFYSYSKFYEFIYHMWVPGEYDTFYLQNISTLQMDPENRIAIFSKTAHSSETNLHPLYEKSMSNVFASIYWKDINQMIIQKFTTGVQGILYFPVFWPLFSMQNRI